MKATSLVAPIGQPFRTLFASAPYNPKYAPTERSWSCSASSPNGDISLEVICGFPWEPDDFDFRASVGLLGFVSAGHGRPIRKLAAHAEYVVGGMKPSIHAVVGAMNRDRLVIASGDLGHGLKPNASRQHTSPMPATPLIKLAKIGLRFNCKRKP